MNLHYNTKQIQEATKLLNDSPFYGEIETDHIVFEDEGDIDSLEIELSKLFVELDGYFEGGE